MAQEKAKSPLVAASEETKDSTQASLDKTLFLGGGNADAAMPVETEDTSRRPSLAERLKAEQQRRGEKRAEDAKSEEPAEASEPEAPVGMIVNLAYWSDETLTKLSPHEPEPTGVIINLESRH